MHDEEDIPAAGLADADRVQGEVIDRLYDVAVDPSRYEELLDHWEAMIAPHRAAANNPRAPVRTISSDYESHFERADRVLDRVIAAGLAEATESILAEFDRTAAFAVNEGQLVVAANAAASASLGISRGAGLRDLPIFPEDLEGLCNGAAALFRNRATTPQLLRARSEDTDRPILFHMRGVWAEDGEPIVILASSELSWPETYGEILSSAFGLTDAEAQVVRALTEGKSLKEVADDRGRSVDTVRAQLKSVMSKTETRSQSELVRLTLSMMELATHSAATAEQLQPPSTGFETLADVPFQTLDLPGGRTMEFLTLGDPAGNPIFYYPLDYGLVRWPASAEEALVHRGLRVVVPVRPGYGNSTPLAKGDDQTRSIVEDTAALLDHLNIERAVFLSLGGDFHFTAAFHTYYPERMIAAIAAAGVLPLDNAKQYERMDKWHRFILAGARYTPHLLPFMVKAGFALARRVGKRGFVHAVYGKSPADVATFEIPEVYEAMVCGSEVCLSETHSAHNAFAREVIQQETTDWSHHVRGMEGSVPVHFFNGLQDPQVPQPTLEEHQQAYPWIDFNVFPDAGQLIFFLKWRNILRCIEHYF